MGALEEVKKMQQQGMQEMEIIELLQQQGSSYKDISDALAQSKIKAAIEAPFTEPIQENNFEPEAMPENNNFQENSPAPVGMQASMLQPQGEENPDTNYFQPENSAYNNQQNYSQPVAQYDYGTQLSTDTITEISEQIVSERLSEMRKKMEKIIDFKTTIEAKTESIEERLKRIEKIIDTLQSSVLRKVGDYMTNVEDIKKELIETQKSFGKLTEMRHPTAHHNPQHHPKHHQDNNMGHTTHHISHHENLKQKKHEK